MAGIDRGADNTSLKVSVCPLLDAAARSSGENVSSVKNWYPA